MHKLIIVLSVLVLFSCTSESTNQNHNTAKKETSETLIPGKKSFAVVWHWKSKDKSLVDKNAEAQAVQLTEFWEKGLVENVYYEAQPQVDKFENYPGVSFFVKASSIAQAREILDEMVFVKEGISEYQIHPVGTKLLGRNDAAISDKGITFSWVAVWTTASNTPMEQINKHAKAQLDAITEQWNAGTIENAYFDMHEAQTSNDITDFVFFINANSEEEARTVAEALPFYQEKIADYQIFSVGVHWMGDKQE